MTGPDSPAGVYNVVEQELPFTVGLIAWNPCFDLLALASGEERDGQVVVVRYNWKKACQVSEGGCLALPAFLLSRLTPRRDWDCS
jgi:hypothetical protein